jgi:uncharacterized OsmC-like protein
MGSPADGRSGKTSFGVAANVRMILRSQLDITVAAAERGGTRPAAELAGRYCPVSNTLRAAGVALDVRATLTSE